MEPRFGQDFSHVRVHADAQAAESASAVNAHAYAVGNQIVFGEGRFAPSQDRGKQILAHELAHVVQQSQVSMDRPLAVASQDRAEREADNVGRSILEKNEIKIGSSKAASEIQRQPIDPNPPAPAGPVSIPNPPVPILPCLTNADCKKSIPGSSWDFSHAVSEKEAKTDQEIKKDPEKAKALGTARPAVNLKAFADKESPNLLSKILQMRVLPSLADAAGAQATDCAGHGPQKGKPACIDVPDNLEKEADLFDNTSGLMIGGLSREAWKTKALSTLVHETQHVDFDQTTPIAAGRTTNFQNVFQYSPGIFLYELGEMNSLLSEFPVQYRGAMAEAKKSTEQKTADIIRWVTEWAINNKQEDLRGMLKKLRCISPCDDVNKAVKDTFARQSTSWTKEQRDLFVGVVSDPKQGLDWPK
jgi:Domain of unknown function (DUF4157)